MESTTEISALQAAEPMATIWADPIVSDMSSPYSIRNGNVTMTGRYITDIDVSTSTAARQTSALASWQMADGNELPPLSLGVANARNFLGTTSY